MVRAMAVVQRWFRPRLEPLEDRRVPALLPGNELLADPAVPLAPAWAASPTPATLGAAADGHFLLAYVGLGDGASYQTIRAELCNADCTPRTAEFQVSQNVITSYRNFVTAAI